MTRTEISDAERDLSQVQFEIQKFRVRIDASTNWPQVNKNVSPEA